MLIEFTKRIEDKVRSEWDKIRTSKETLCEALYWWANRCFMLEERQNALYIKGAIDLIENAFTRMENELNENREEV